MGTEQIWGLFFRVEIQYLLLLFGIVYLGASIVYLFTMKRNEPRKFFGYEYNHEKFIENLELSPPRPDDKKDLYLFILFNLLGFLLLGILIYSISGNKTIGRFDLSDSFLITGIVLWGTNLIREFRYKIKAKMIVAVFAIIPLFIGYLTVRGIVYS